MLTRPRILWHLTKRRVGGSFPKAFLCRSKGQCNRGGFFGKLPQFNMRSLITLLFLAIVTVGRAAIEWKYAVGLHDMLVPEADHSHTFGIHFFTSAEETLPSGIHWLGTGEVLLDRDKDDLDPDHIPVWWRLHGGIDGPIKRFSDSAQLSWVGDFDTRVNTVSSIEREIRALPGLMLNLKAGRCSAQLKAEAGYFLVEIDDDVPKERGYDRSGLTHETFASSLAADGAIDLNSSWRLAAHAQGWWEGDGWLETQYRGEVDFSPGQWAHGGMIALSAEYTQYNLDPYTPANSTGPYLPILPWDHDWLMKLSYIRRW
jgi:hypothetical protein